MKNVFLQTSDGGFGVRLASVLQTSETLVRAIRDGDLVEGRKWVVLLDCRGRSAASVNEECERIRSRLGEEALLVCLDLVRREHVGVEYRRWYSGRPNELLFRTYGDMEAIARTVLHDPNEQLVRAIALCILMPSLPKKASDLATAVLSTGLVTSNMKGVCAALRCHRSTVERQLQAEGSPPPAAIVELCRAASAIIELRTARGSIRDAAIALGFSSPNALDRVLRRVFGMSASACRLEMPQLSAAEYLSLSVARRHALPSPGRSSRVGPQVPMPGDREPHV